MKRPTTDADGRYNGYLVEIWSVLTEPDLFPNQVFQKIWGVLEQLDLRPKQMDLFPIWDALNDPELRPDQVYLTAVAPRSRKGPHLHKKRRGLFYCIKGPVRILRRNNTGLYMARITGEPDRLSELVKVPPGVACALYNLGDEEALVLNMPSPAWSKEEPDDWPVEGWID